MANPFGITEVDAPGLLAMYSQRQQQSIEQQYRQAALARQAKMDTRADETYERDETKRKAREAVFDTSTLVDPDGLPARTDGLAVNKEALRNLYKYDPEGAAQIQKHIYDADKATFDRIQQRGTAMAQVAGSLRGVPADQRRAALAQRAPELQALGFTPEQLAAVDLTDAGLNRYYASGKSMEQLVAGDKEEADRALRERTFAETQRHNRVGEGQAGAREARITKWGPQAIVIGGAAPRSDTTDLDY